MTAATGDVKVTIDNRARSCSGQNTRIGAAESGVVLWIARREGGQDSSDDLQIGRRSREFLREQPDAARSSPPARWLSVIRPMLRAGVAVGTARRFTPAPRIACQRPPGGLGASGLVAPPSAARCATATPHGLPPTFTRFSTVPVATSTIETSPEGPLAV